MNLASKYDNVLENIPSTYSNSFSSFSLSVNENLVPYIAF